MQELSIPKNEILWTTYHDHTNQMHFFVTSTKDRAFYLLYEVDENGRAKKLGKAISPLELEERYNVWGKIKEYS